MLVVFFFYKGDDYMTPQNASKLGRKLWRTNRAMYERRRKFGEEEERIEGMRQERQEEYNRHVIDSFRTWDENKRLVRLQIKFMREQGRALIWRNG